MDQSELDEVVRLHGMWLRGEGGGRRADLTGANLTNANLRHAILTGAILTGADLWNAILTDAILTEATLRGANLEDADLTGANLEDADLEDANLTRAILTGAILTDAALPPAPIVVDLDRIVLDMVDTDVSMLDMGTWHTCQTTHCLAGWATTLAEGGKALEEELSPAVAGALIWHASVGYVPDFYASGKSAVAELRQRVAEREGRS